ncbi:MAG: hypothetical protein AAAFM81_05555 [Pseudomonadota bacterium]
MQISRPVLGQSPRLKDHCRVSARFRFDAPDSEWEDVWFEFPQHLETHIDTSGTAWVAALLPLACQRGEDLLVDAELDAEFLDNSRQLMEWYWFWKPDQMQPVAIKAQGLSRRTAVEPERTATFFSGGADSFFTLVRHLDVTHSRDVTHLLIGHGFDLKIDDTTAFDEVTTSIDAVAHQFGKTMLPFATNIRETSFGKVPWGFIGHGNAMAAAAILLSPMFGTILVPSSDGYREDKIWGTDPYLDHLFSTSNMRIVHEGSAFTRLEKVAAIADVPGTLPHLRVCWQSWSANNCGECEKCYRTQIAIDIVGKLSLASSFPEGKYRIENIRKIYCPADRDSAIRIYYNDMQQRAIKNGRPDIAREIGLAKRRSRLLRPLFKVKERCLKSVKLYRLGVMLERFLAKRCLS